MTAEQLTRLLGTDWALGGGTLAGRLALGLRHLLEGEVLAGGTRLPPERALAHAFHVSRPTVTAALGELRERGLLESRQGSGTWVAERAATVPSSPAMSELVLTGRGINLAAATAHDASHLGPLDVDLLAATPAHGLDPSGLPALREHLAQRHGLELEGLIVTNGAHHALALVIGALCRPGERVIVEEHTYAGFLDLLEAARVRAIAIPRDTDGPEPRALERAIRRAQPRLVYLMPKVHAPSGATTTPERREELAAILNRHTCTTVSDDTLAELGPPAEALEADSLITIGTLSKSLWSGLRVGWLQASADVRQRILSHRARVDLGTAVAAQQVALQLTSRMDALLAERAAQLRAKAERLRAGLPPEWAVPMPDGGLCLWARLPLADAAPYVTAAARAGVLVMPGAVARADRAADPHIRLCFDRPAGLLDEAIARLRAAWQSSPDSGARVTVR